MGLFSRLFKSKQAETICAYPLPDVMENAINTNNPYRGRYKNTGTNNAVYLLYCDFSSSYKWIQDSIKPDIYFQNYIKSLQILSELIAYKRKHFFNSPTPSQQNDDLRSNYTENTNRFISRYWMSTIENAKKLKTEKGKQNRINKFFDTLLNDYFPYLTCENISHINSFKNKRLDDYVEITKQEIQCGKYDVSTIENILSIPNNDFEIMRPLQKAATSHKRNGDLNLAIECLKKSNSICDNLPKQAIKLTQKEYLRVIKYIELTGDSELLKKEKQRISKVHPEFWDRRISNKKHIKETISHCIEMDNDLIQISTNNSCSICGEYDKKIYSISGKNKKYPMLPEEIRNQTHDCKDCYMLAYSYFDGINS